MKIIRGVAGTIGMASFFSLLFAVGSLDAMSVSFKSGMLWAVSSLGVFVLSVVIINKTERGKTKWNI